MLRSTAFYKLILVGLSLKYLGLVRAAAFYFTIDYQNQKAYMQVILVWILLKNVMFVTSTFSKTETFYINLLFAMDVMMLHYVLYC